MMKGLKKLIKESQYTATQLGQMLRPNSNKILSYQMINRWTTEGTKKASMISVDDLKALKNIFGCSYEDIIDG